ncbi:LysR family transcriptional regulator [Hydrogenophaga sp.]|uniref:LysR family transcriptional regulator n=1 Tax=Hydrogenophaga sp. TaxID=1904254 RepID=UPI0035612E0F
MHSPTKFQWDDLRYLLAVAREGSTLAAGRALGVDQSTVQRRLAELERRIGQSLVQRQPTGYRLTEFGQDMLPFAETVESAVLAFERQIQTLGGEIRGVIRMTCPEPIVNRIAQTGLLDRFHARHPALSVQFVMSDKYMDLRQGDADVALRSGDTDDGELVGRKIGDSVWAIYASKAYIAQHGQPACVQDLASHALVGFDATMAKHRLSLWLREVVPNAELASRSSSVLGLIYSVKAGLGVGALPMPLGDAEPDLVRVLGPVTELTRIWRMLTTPELRRTPRVSAFFDFIVEEIDTLQPILTG